MLVLCPTADYEIYLGRNLLPAEQVLFQPMQKMLDLWEEFGLRATIFPDICSIWRHRELGLQDYADRCEVQIRDIAARGHDVQLHLHPEWRNAQRVDSSWSFPPGSGSLHDLGFSADDPHGAPALIRRGRAYLHELLDHERTGYRCLAFRAGGWVLQPEHELVAALLAAGIRVDATVIPGVRLLRTDYPVDFTQVPPAPNWYIGARQGIGVDSGDPADLFEIPIAAFRGRWPMRQHVLNEIRLRRRAKRTREAQRGYPMGKVGLRFGPVEKMRRKWRKLNVPRVLDAADTCESMLATVRSYLHRYDCVSRDVAVCMNGHPKDTYDVHLDEMRRFFDRILSREAGRVRFSSVTAYYTRLQQPSGGSPSS